MRQSDVPAGPLSPLGLATVGVVLALDQLSKEVEDLGRVLRWMLHGSSWCDPRLSAGAVKEMQALIG